MSSDLTSHPADGLSSCPCPRRLGAHAPQGTQAGPTATPHVEAKATLQNLHRHTGPSLEWPPGVGLGGGETEHTRKYRRVLHVVLWKFCITCVWINRCTNGHCVLFAIK